ncbi:efflux RND transporter periplasmic adaptor subunit [Rudanella lutea]|uniref:efflux RND transporter periplasmic adaptor subunit n=1 Tax=Rudanella lutea TaxID=451374 RepID=UPI0003629763|nr:efflux RND transporter periplasmic adaptor subunit [Rudanella lutea]
MKRWIAIGLVVLIVGGVVAYNKFGKSKKEDPAAASAGGGGRGPGGPGGGGPGGPGGPGGGNRPTSVTGFVVVSQALKEEVVASGSLLAAEQIDIYPEVAGRITQLSIREGQPVSQGSLLVKLYDADLRAQLQRLYVQQENAQRTEERNKQLLQRGGISQQEYDIVVTNLKSALADIELVKANLRRTEIRAPFSGVIGLRNVSPGAYVTPQTLIARLQQTSSLKLDFSIPEKYGPSLKNGSGVTFTVDGLQQRFNGTVYATEPSVEEETRNLRVRARVNNNGARLRPGTFAKVTLAIQNESGLVVPTQAVIPQTRGKQVVVVRNGKAIFQDVTTGIRTASAIQILSGLSQGDTVATTGLLFLKPDGPVKVAKVAGLPKVPLNPTTGVPATDAQAKL